MHPPYVFIYVSIIFSSLYRTSTFLHRVINLEYLQLYETCFIIFIYLRHSTFGKKLLNLETIEASEIINYRQLRC